MVKVQWTKKFEEWMGSLNLKERNQVLTRIQLIETEGYFGMFRRLFGDLFELKWGNGRRVYFTFLGPSTGTTILVLLGGNKNTQVKDITEAQLMIRKLERDK